MKKIFVKDIIRECNAELFSGDINLECINFSKDTRNINKNDIYVGIKGESFNGNLFYEDAFEKGASACIIEKEYFDKENFNDKYKNRGVILVDNSITALQKIAHYKRSLYDIPVVAVTGSVGKTSVKDMISTILSSEYNVLKTEGNLNNHIGLPLTILKLKDHDALVVEMGMNHFGEISLLSNIANPTIAVITNVGTAHIGNLGSRENIMKAKLEILDGMSEKGTLIINNDNDLLNKYKDEICNKTNLITIGINNDSDYKATNINEDVYSSEFYIENNKINIEIGGEVFIYNSLIAYACAKKLNISDENIINSIKNFRLEKNRLEKNILKNGCILINDTYNASYDSMVNAIDLIDKNKDKRKILLIGDILELGDYSEEIHRNIGKYIISKDIDLIILVGNEVNYIKEELINNNFNKDNIYHFDKEYETYDLLNNLLNEKDIILIKGSHGMNLINIVENLRK